MPLVDELKSHIVSVCLIVALAFGGIYGVESLVAKHDSATATRYEVLAKQQSDQNAQLQANIQKRLDSLEAQNAVLTLALSKRQTVEVTIPTTNGSLSAQETATKLVDTTNAKPGEVTALQDALTVDLPVAHVLLDDAQLVPLLQADKADLSKELVNSNQALSLEKTAHTSDNTTGAANLKACQVEIVSVKAQARKSKLRWFAVGYASGWISRKFVGL